MEAVRVLRGSLDGYGDGSGDGSGYGYGYGYGSGSGNGNGSGSGNGYGSGDGYGDGSGYGSGYGNGSGSGNGDGSGSGDGDGSGYAYGYGYGSGYGSGDGSGDGYWGAVIEAATAAWPTVQRDRLTAVRAAGARIAYWLSDESGQPCNGGTPGVPAAPGVVHTAPGPLSLCEPGTLHATLLPPKWRGQRWWIVALHGEVVGDAMKLGCCRREILGEVQL